LDPMHYLASERRSMLRSISSSCFTNLPIAAAML
jgi:hypothetical protein